MVRKATKWIFHKHKLTTILVFFVFIGLLCTIYFKYYVQKSFEVSFLSAKNIQAKKDSIFFHETSEKGELTIRQACCVESCALMNSESKINVIFSSTLYSSIKTLNLLQTYDNIHFYIVDLEQYAKNTPMEKFDLSILLKSKWPMQVASDALRYLTLYKYGGVYLDLDVMVVRPLRFLGKNWTAKEFDKIGSGALVFGTDKLGRYVAEESVMGFVRHFKVTSYINNGPVVIGRVLHRLCHHNKSRSDINIIQQPFTCKDFKIYDNITFTSLGYNEAKAYYMTKYTMFLKRLYTENVYTENVYGYHMFNYMTKKYKIEKYSFYSELAKRFCPKIYEEFLHEFSH